MLLSAHANRFNLGLTYLAEILLSVITENAKNERKVKLFQYSSRQTYAKKRWTELQWDILTVL